MGGLDIPRGQVFIGFGGFDSVFFCFFLVFVSFFFVFFFVFFLLGGGGGVASFSLSLSWWGAVGGGACGGVFCLRGALGCLLFFSQVLMCLLVGCIPLFVFVFLDYVVLIYVYFG